MIHILTARGNENRTEQFIIYQREGMMYVQSFNGYDSQVYGKTLTKVIRELEVIEEVTRIHLESRNNLMYQYKFFTAVEPEKILVTYTFNSRLSQTEMRATIDLLEYEHGGEEILYTEEIFGE